MPDSFNILLDLDEHAEDSLTRRGERVHRDAKSDRVADLKRSARTDVPPGVNHVQEVAAADRTKVYLLNLLRATLIPFEKKESPHVPDSFRRARREYRES